jgi:putative transposase
MTSHDRTGGTGHLYQGRFKSCPVQDDEHLLTVMRCVERNSLRAGLVERVEDWPWGTLFLRSQRDVAPWLVLPTDLPLLRQWRAHVNKPQTEAEVTALSFLFPKFASAVALKESCSYILCCFKGDTGFP